MEAASGYYLNLFDKHGNDIFLVINEPNSEPTVVEYLLLQQRMEKAIKENVGIDRDKLYDVLNEVVEQCGCKCLEFGFQIVIRKYRQARKESGDLEGILQKHFNCKKPFLKHPYYDSEERAPVTLTKNGSRAYSDLIDLVYSIGNITGYDVNRIVDQLDSIADAL